jgi:hypothetical protein
MNHHFADILALTEKEPVWFDYGGVPRFCEFAPWETLLIYGDTAMLMEIECQGCGQVFKVGISGDALEHLVASNEIHYGDPPNMDCCPAGATMNSRPRRVLEFWTRRWVGAPRDFEENRGWFRKPELERTIEPGW